ncbi:hypothetical protein UG96_07480 [Streptococcus gallolyticus subsp. gallolyticus]|uniref:hypothetical protein n=1 Tax=Streptococcus gallolyticus TaxID=315405 RepID=UPI0005CEAFE1|nr:hypothetical protein [Streptococcus gallolyticus]KJE99190.1 hypothetical protein UG96_07480 [Streptococcus gallolyticus subsp. gallolyticus]
MMNKQEYFDYCQKELTRYEASQYQLMELVWEELNEADHVKLLEIGSKVMFEDSTVDLYLLNRDKRARLKMWDLIARTMLHYDKKLPTEDRLNSFSNHLERHFKNMVNRVLERADYNKLNQLFKELDLPEDVAEQFKRNMVLAGLV